MVAGIANILHRHTLSVIVGKKLVERGEQCFAAGRVVTIETETGSVRPNEAGREHYITRIWMRDEGLASECTCPIGSKRQFYASHRGLRPRSAYGRGVASRSHSRTSSTSARRSSATRACCARRY